MTQPGSHPAVHNFLKTVDYLSSGSKTVPVFSQVRFREAGQRCNLWIEFFEIDSVATESVHVTEMSVAEVLTATFL